MISLSPQPLCASPLQEADPSRSRGDHVLSVTPPLQFSVDERLKRNVAFWVDIYSKYCTFQGLVHDAKYIDKIYEVIDYRAARSSPSRANRAAKDKWKKILMNVHRKQSSPESMTEEEKRVFAMYADVNEPNKFLNAVHRRRLRIQVGQKDRFLDGLHQSGKYMAMMEDIFRREGLPTELTRLPFVESSFNIRARSKVGASGIWQFMRSTGRLFLKINDGVDERNDPIRATEAAAKLLRMNFESLKSWPLAVTAYNHGRKGIMRAVRKVGSDELEELVSDYRSRSFGFASSNFFTELLAAVEVERNAEKYFGEVARSRRLEFIEVRVGDYIALQDLERFLKIDVEAVRDLNPGLTSDVFKGRRLVPAGYRLRLPKPEALSAQSAIELFEAGYAQIPGLFKYKTQRAGSYGTKLPARRHRRATASET